MGHGSGSLVFSDRVREGRVCPQLIDVPVIRRDPLDRSLDHIGDGMLEVALPGFLLVHLRAIIEVHRTETLAQ